MKFTIPFLCRLWHRWDRSDNSPGVKFCKRCGKVEKFVLYERAWR